MPFQSLQQMGEKKPTRKWKKRRKVEQEKELKNMMYLQLIMRNVDNEYIKVSQVDTQSTNDKFELATMQKDVRAKSLLPLWSLLPLGLTKAN